jgi:tetratricopeptide (TPR) repeat protein
VVDSMTHEGKIKSSLFSSNTRYIATIGKDNSSIHVWLWQSSDLIEEACQRLTRNLSLDEWKQYFGQEPYTKTCENLPVHPSLIEQARDLARNGDTNAANAIFARIKEIEPEIDLNPEREIRNSLTLKAKSFIRRGEKFAKLEMLEQAITEFKKANDLTPGLVIDPEKKARKIAAQELIRHGYFLLVNGNTDKARHTFQKAQELDPDLSINFESEKQKAEAHKLVAQGREFQEKREYKKALFTYKKAQEIDSSINIPDYTWNELCWLGSLKGYATDVIYACEKAVKLSPKNGDFRDSRGLARAMTGDVKGAISDFQVYIDSTDNEELKIKRQQWIKSLRSGKNPVTFEEIKRLLKQ